MNKYPYFLAATVVFSGSIAFPAYAEVGVGLDTTGSGVLRANSVVQTGTDVDVSVGIGNHATTSATTTVQAKTQADIVASLRAKDDRVEEVMVANDAVALTYRVDGRFLGLVHSSVPVRVEVENDGSVDLAYPWYAFLYFGRPNDLEQKVEAAVQVNGAWNENSFTVAKRAEIIADIHAALKANATAATSVSVNVE